MSAKRRATIDRAIASRGSELYRSNESELDVCSKSRGCDLRTRIDGDLFEYEVESAVRRHERRVRWTWNELQRWEHGESGVCSQTEDQREGRLGR